jgi:hypothetical protein
MLPMLDARYHGPHCGDIAGQFIGNQHARCDPLPLEQLAQKTLGGLCVSAALDQDIEYGAVLVNGPPQPMLLAADADDDLVEMSFVSWCGQTPADLVGKALAEFHRPLPHCLMADQDTAGGQHLLDHAQAQGEPEVQPNRVADDFSWEATTGITRVTGVLHPSPMRASGHLSVKLTGPTQPCPIRVDNPSQALRRFRAP